MKKMKTIMLGVFGLTVGLAGAEPTKSVKLAVSGYTGEETLVNFPVAVRLSAATPGFSYERCRPDGADVSFALGDGTVLNREIESWDPSGESIVWVSVPELKDGTVLYLRYSDLLQTEQPASQTDGSVWSAAGYKLVMHFASGADFLKDSIAKTNEKITRNGGAEASGFFGGGLSLSGGDLKSSSVTIEQGNVTTMTDKSKCTVSFRFKKPANSIEHGKRIFCGNKSASAAAFDIMQWSSGSNVGLCIRGSGSGNGIVMLKSADFDWSVWNLFGFVFDGTSVQAYTNGYATAMVSSTITAINDFSSNPIYVGNYGGGTGIAGAFDECRIRDGVSSADWLLAEQETAGEFLTFEPVEAAGDTLTVIGVPGQYGTPSPDWGVTNGLAVGASFVCSIPSVCTNFETGAVAVPIGWQLMDANGEESDHGSTTSFAYEHQGASTLFWNFELTAYRVAVTAGEGGSVDKAVSWVPVGESVSVTAIPGEHFAFHHWITPNGPSTDNPILVTPTEAVELTAVFAQTVDLTEDGEVTLEEAVASFGGAPGVINLAAGTYTLTDELTLSSSIVIRGVGRDVTTIVAAANKRVLTLDHPEVAVSGVTLRGTTSGARTGNGAVVGITANGGAISDCRITGGKFTANSKGSGLYMEGGTVVRTLIDGNAITTGADSKGGGLYLAGGLVDCCLITNNECRAYGGGVYQTGGRIVGSTIAGNRVTYSSCHGAGLSMCGTPESEAVVNCVIYGNLATSSLPDAETDANWHCTAGYAASFVRCASSTAVGTDAQALVDSDFVNAAAGDWHLSSSSPCIDNGLAYAGSFTTTDFDGKARVFGDAQDIGCYEYVVEGFACGFKLSSSGVFANEDVTFEATKPQGFAKGEELDYVWTVTTDGRPPVVFSGATAVRFFANTGRYTVTLTVTSKSDATRQAVATAENALLVAAERIDLVAGDSIEEAVARAITGTKIYLGAGEYEVSNEVAVVAGVEIRGAGRDQTVVKRATGVSYVRIFMLNHPLARLAGMTIAKGRLSTGGNGTRDVSGAGVLIDAEGGTLCDCTVTGCTIGWGGYGAVACLSSSGLVDRVVFKDNKDFMRGGGLCLARGICRNSLFVGNDASVAGAIYVSTVASVTPSNVRIENCTFTQNSATGSYTNSGAIDLGDGAKPTIVNCIFIDNTAAGATEDEPHVDWRSLEACTVSNCLFASAAAMTGKNPVWGTPEQVFRVLTDNDGRTKRWSPSLDKGAALDWMTPDATDLYGRPRVVNKIPDIGCCENPQSGLMLEIW